MPLTLSVSESAGFDLHEEDEWFDGTITAIEETDGTWGPGLKFIIELDGDTYTLDDGSEIQRDTWAFTSQKLSKRSKLYSWAKGLGWDPAEDTLDLEGFINARCQVMFEHYDGTDQEGNPVEKEKVTKIRKGKGAARTPAKTVKPVDDDEAPF